jgi:radical SAM superfamily enzyme YgiQ (UPF0313 family)
VHTGRRGRAVNARNLLCVFPKYAPSFGTFDYSYPLVGVRGFMPPQGILTIAAYLPANWNVRFIDENLRAATPADFSWADAVFVSGMHIQRTRISEIAHRAHEAGRVAVLGGPSVSGCPEWYPEFDYLHVGEMGNATDELIARLDADPLRPPAQVRLETNDRLPLHEFPVPAYHLVDLSQYFLGSVQFSSGCPYRCEFCDIPELYGRNPRLKSPGQVVAELDAIVLNGGKRAIYFVDDNFVGNRKAAKELLPHLIEWQRENGFPVQLACEATLNIAKSPDLLALMRDAFFCTIFCGIETPDTDALKSIAKEQNNHIPVMEAIEVMNSYGMEVVSGIIMGLDSDTPGTADDILAFIERSNIPLLTINLLQALPRTPLYRRLQAEGRLIDEQGDRESNVRFLMPYDQVVGMWRRVFTAAYQPEALYARFAYQLERVFPNRIKPPNSAARVNAANIKMGLRLLANVLFRVGVLSGYRSTFWKMAWPRLRQGDLEGMLHVSFVSYHLIEYARKAGSGCANASFYSAGSREAGPASQPSISVDAEEALVELEVLPRAG